MTNERNVNPAYIMFDIPKYHMTLLKEFQQPFNLCDVGMLTIWGLNEVMVAMTVSRISSHNEA